MIRRTRRAVPSSWSIIRGGTGGVALKPIIDSRETTPAEDSQSDDDDEVSVLNCLVLPFDKLLSLDHIQNGLQLGTNTASSHVLLGHRRTKGISGKQVGQLVLYECIPNSAICMSRQSCYRHVPKFSDSKAT